MDVSHINKREFYTPVNLTQLPLDTIPDNAGSKKTEDMQSSGVKQENDIHSMEEILYSEVNATVEGFTKDDAKKVVKTVFDKIGSPVQQAIDFMNDTNGWIASKFTSDPVEKQVIERNIENLLSIGLSFYITYNWYFMIFYKEMGKRIPRINLSMSYISDNYPIIHLALKYNLICMSCLDWLLCDWWPYVVDESLLQFLPQIKPAWMFIFLFLIVKFVLYYYGRTTLNRLIDALQLKVDSSIGLVIGFMFLYGAASMVALDTWPNMVQRAVQYTQAPIMTLVIYLVRIFIVSIPLAFISIITTCFYLIFMSLFAIPYYGSPNIMKHIKDMYKFMTLELAPVGECGECDSWFIIKFLRTALKGPMYFLLTYIFQIVIIIALIHAIQDYALNLKKGETCQWKMITISVMLILGIIGYEIYMIIIKNQKKKRMLDLAVQFEKLISKTNPTQATTNSTSNAAPGSSNAAPGSSNAAPGSSNAAPGSSNAAPGSSNGTSEASNEISSSLSSVPGASIGAPGSSLSVFTSSVMNGDLKNTSTTKDLMHATSNLADNISNPLNSLSGTVGSKMASKALSQVADGALATVSSVLPAPAKFLAKGIGSVAKGAMTTALSKASNLLAVSKP